MVTYDVLNSHYAGFRRQQDPDTCYNRIRMGSEASQVRSDAGLSHWRTSTHGGTHPQLDPRNYVSRLEESTQWQYFEDLPTTIRTETRPYPASFAGLGIMTGFGPISRGGDRNFQRANIVIDPMHSISSGSALPEIGTPRSRFTPQTSYTTASSKANDEMSIDRLPSARTVRLNSSPSSSTPSEGHLRVSQLQRSETFIRSSTQRHCSDLSAEAFLELGKSFPDNQDIAQGSTMDSELANMQVPQNNMFQQRDPCRVNTTITYDTDIYQPIRKRTRSSSSHQSIACRISKKVS